MELAGTAYLYALVATAMTFVGFSAIVIIIRQMLGAGLSPFQILLMQLLVEHGFVVAFFSLFPLLLALFPLSHEAVWRVCSGVVTFVVAGWLLDYMLRRYRTVSARPFPIYVWINIVVQTCSLVALLINAIGLWFRPQAGPYAFALTWVLLQGVDIFLLSLRAFLRPPRTASVEQ